MKNLKLSYKIILISVAAILTISALIVFTQTYINKEDFAFTFGVLCLIAGLLQLFVGIILLASNSKEWRNGFLLSGAILLLLSGISCGGGAALL